MEVSNMNERQRYIVTTDTNQYHVDLNEAEIEELYRLHHGFVRIAPQIEAHIVNDSWKDFKFDHDLLAQEIADAHD
jgi:hypothetical protein